MVGGEVIGSQHHQPLSSNKSGVCVLAGSIQLTSPTWWGFSNCKTTQRYRFVYPVREDQDLAPRLHYCFLIVLPLSPHLLPSLISNCLNLLIGTQERWWRLNEAYFLQTKNGGHRKAFVPRSPIGSCLVSLLHSLFYFLSI